ncbi:SPOSA6832_02239 [Sporobolomyces salmonicolor]|uniref:SPOSA6832_02239-mRNA-1:cds n=1 Tax=Sporidiobolus salmonicolor TaxID=5005 RepID=A0A0D6EL09_SPOSA|nr:SPOSA6832_02239 [Sporobolomyces salmonicolor]
MRWTALLLGLVLPLAAQAAPDIPKTTATTLVDLLSASPDHSLLLAAFQHARLIPTLNRLNGSTLFAPTNDAIRAERDREAGRSEADAATDGGLSSTSIWSHVVDCADRPCDDLDDADSDRNKRDNLQFALRETLLYHLLNYTLFPPPSNHSSLSSSHPLPLDVPTLQETLLFPTLSPYNRSFPAPPSLPGSEPDQPDPSAPPKDRPEGLLRGEGQRVRVMMRKGDGRGKNEIRVGVDWRGAGGVKGERKIEHARNGDFVSLDGVLQKPKDLATLIRTEPSVSTFASLLPSQVLDYISTAPHMTVFAPTNDAWDALSDLEMRYLRSGFAEMDLSEIFDDGASQEGAGKGKVGYLEKLVGEKSHSGSNITTLRNGTLEVVANGPEITVNGSKIETGDILAKNGVLHTVPSLLLPSGSLSLTAEKYLIALSATRFVSLLRSVNLSHYVQIPSNQPTFTPQPLPPVIDDVAGQAPLFSLSSATTKEKTRYTILAVRDDVLALSEGKWGYQLPSPGSPELKELLEYHIVSGKWVRTELEDGMLVGTELRPEQLKGARQRLAVSVQDAEGGRGEGWKSKGGKDKKDQETLIGWGSANVVADPVVVGDSVIYLISSVLEPPTSVITSAVSDLRLSTFVASVYAATLDGTLATQPAVTYLVPTNKAFASLGLAMSYLLLPSARQELRSLLKYHAIDELVYLDDFPRTGSARYPTLLDGAEIYFERDPVNSTLAVHGPTLGGHPANGEARNARVVEGDILTETGTIHVIDQVELPAELDITVEKLLRGAKANTMVELIQAANMSWVLRGKRPPADSVFATDDDDGKRKKKHKSRRFNVDRAYTILCPTDKAFSRLNLTYYLANPPALSALVQLHIIPTDALSPSSDKDAGTPLPLVDSITYPTLLSRSEGGASLFGTVAFKQWGEGEGAWMVGIEGARGTRGESDSARVVAWGRATPWFVEGKPDHDGDGDGEKKNDEEAYVLGLAGWAEAFATKLAAGGGVITIDSVLLPYEPGWLRRWGWIVLTVFAGVAVVGLAVGFGVRAWRKRKGLVQYERLEGEED